MNDSRPKASPPGRMSSATFEAYQKARQADRAAELAAAERRGYTKAIDEAATVAANYGLGVSGSLRQDFAYRQTHIAAAILALKRKSE